MICQQITKAGFRPFRAVAVAPMVRSSRLVVVTGGPLQRKMRKSQTVVFSTTAVAALSVIAVARVSDLPPIVDSL